MLIKAQNCFKSHKNKHLELDIVHIPVMPALKGQRQEDVSYIACSRLAQTIN